MFTRLQAIQDTLEMHKMAQAQDITYKKIKFTTADDICPLCAYSSKAHSKMLLTQPDLKADACSFCPWILYTGHACYSEEENLLSGQDMTEYSYTDNDLSISRLEQWIQREENKLKCT